MIMAFLTVNIRDEISLRLSKNNFRPTSGVRNLDFRFLFTASKDAEFNLKGSHKWNFQYSRIFFAMKIDFRALRPARIVSLK